MNSLTRLDACEHVSVIEQLAPIIAIEHAVAFLILTPPPTQSARDECASALLRCYTGDARIVIRRRPSGRPRLDPPYPQLGVAMSLRPGGMLIGFNPFGAVGVDIERADSVPASEVVRMARDHFSAAESKAVTSLDVDAACRLFLRIWVAKEAGLKLTGRGVFDGLAQPDLGSCLGAIASDGVVLAVPAGSHVPALEIALRQVSLPGGALAYCALAASNEQRVQC